MTLKPTSMAPTNNFFCKPDDVTDRDRENLIEPLVRLLRRNFLDPPTPAEASEIEDDNFFDTYVLVFLGHVFRWGWNTDKEAEEGLYLLDRPEGLEDKATLIYPLPDHEWLGLVTSIDADRNLELIVVNKHQEQVLAIPYDDGGRGMLTFLRPLVEEGMKAHDDSRFFHLFRRNVTIAVKVARQRLRMRAGKMERDPDIMNGDPELICLRLCRNLKGFTESIEKLYPIWNHLLQTEALRYKRST